MSSGVSQLASKVGCPSTRGHSWSRSPHSGAGTGAIGPGTRAQVTSAAGALAATACKRAPCRREDVETASWAVQALTCRFSSFYPFAALTVPGECGPSGHAGDACLHLTAGVERVYGCGPISCACSEFPLLLRAQPSLSPSGWPAAEPVGRTVVTQGWLWRPLGAWRVVGQKAVVGSVLSCVPSPSRCRELAAGGGGTSPPSFLGEQRTPPTGMPGLLSWCGPSLGLFLRVSEAVTPSWVRGAEGPSAGGPGVQRLVGAPHPSL